MKVKTSNFGKLPDGRPVNLFTFESAKGFVVKITNYGGIITSIQTPNKLGVKEEISAGFPSLENYINGHPHFGVMVGRYANRIANGRFTLDHREYNLPINNGPNHLHGGNNGFHTKLWDFKLSENKNFASLELTYNSPHLEEGYPGNVKTTITYNLHDTNEIHITFKAVTDEPTHLNLTNHCYFNLGGFKTDVLSHKLTLDAYAYLPVNENLIPTGEIRRWDGTAFDLSKPNTLSKKIKEIPGGIDHCFALKQPRSLTKPAAKLLHEQSGRWLKVYCTQPGIQVYTGNALDSSIVGHKNTVYHKYSAVCLETQHFPDTPNQPNFPMTLIMPDEEYFHEIRYVFGVIE